MRKPSLNVTNSKPKAYYAVREGWKSGIYFTYEACQQQIAKFSAPKFKKFSTLKEAEEWLMQPEIKRSRLYVAPRVKPLTNDNSPPQVIFSCGVVNVQGTKGRIGVHWASCDDDNVSKARNSSEEITLIPSLRCKVLTPQRVELLAMIKALRSVADYDGAVEIKTDSRYASHVCTHWLTFWKNQEWKTLEGKEARNMDLLRELDRLLEKRLHPTYFTEILDPAAEPGLQRALRPNS